MMNLVMVLIFGVFTYLTFKVMPTPAMITGWGVTGIALMLSWLNVVSSFVLFLLFIMLVVILMVSGIYENM